jgi:hypothetical protein
VPAPLADRARFTRFTRFTHLAILATGATLALAACAGFDATGLGDEAELPSSLARDAGHELGHVIELGCGHDAAFETHATTPPALFEVGALD